MKKQIFWWIITVLLIGVFLISAGIGDKWQFLAPALVLGIYGGKFVFVSRSGLEQGRREKV